MHFSYSHRWSFFLCLFKPTIIQGLFHPRMNSDGPCSIQIKATQLRLYRIMLKAYPDSRRFDNLHTDTNGKIQGTVGMFLCRIEKVMWGKVSGSGVVGRPRRLEIAHEW